MMLQSFREPPTSGPSTERDSRERGGLSVTDTHPLRFSNLSESGIVLLQLPNGGVANRGVSWMSLDASV